MSAVPAAGMPPPTCWDCGELEPHSREERHEQQGRRFGIVVQSDALLRRSAVLVAPTSTVLEL